MSIKSTQGGMTLLEVLVGFVIFSASLVAILDYVSNQIYLNHLTEKNEARVSLIDGYAALSSLGEEARIEYITAQDTMSMSVNSRAVDSIEKGRLKLSLMQSTIVVSDQNNSYEWSILELR